LDDTCGMPSARRRREALLSDLEQQVNDAVAIEPELGPTVETAVGFFDLVGSTALKVNEGHFDGTLAALQHNAICTAVAAHFHGTVVKSLGDGILMTFPSTIDAALAAANIAAGMSAYTDLETKVGLTTGVIEQITVEWRDDIMGSVVDRCARLQALAKPGEIIVDQPFVSSVQTMLLSYSGISLQGPTQKSLRGVGQADVWGIVVG
jgi:class 3 adenylate cyclase